MAGKNIPPALDAQLRAMAAEKELSPALRKRFDRVFLDVARAFYRLPPDQGDLLKGLSRTRDCLALAMSDGGPEDRAVVPLLERIATLLAAELPANAIPADVVREPAVVAPAAAPPPAPRSQAPSRQPTQQPAWGRPSQTLSFWSGLPDDPAPPRPEDLPTPPPVRLPPVVPPRPEEVKTPPPVWRAPVVPPRPEEVKTPPPVWRAPVVPPRPEEVKTPPPVWRAPPSQAAPAPPAPFVPPVAHPPPAAWVPDWPPPQPGRTPYVQPAPPPAPAAPWPPAPRAERRERAVAMTAADSASAIVVSLLPKLAGLYDRRVSVGRDLLATWRDLEAVDGEIARAVRTLAWIGGDGAAAAEEALGVAEDEGQRFAAVLALLHTGAAATVLDFFVERDAGGAAPPGALAALRLGADGALLGQIEAFAPPDAGLRAAILRARADRGELAGGALVALADDPDGGVAACAAELLAWCGSPPGDTEAALGLLRAPMPAARRDALLFAAVALGSAEALQRIRELLDQGRLVTAAAIDALAVAGAPGDAARLLALAARDPACAPLATLAAAHLGDPETAAALAVPVADDGSAGDETPDGVVDPNLIAHARQAILGPGPPPPLPRHGRAAGAPSVEAPRLLHGAPWTVAAALARLGAPGELVRARAWYALEVGVRSGVRPGAVLDGSAAAAVQRAATAAIGAALAGRRLPPPGSWFHGGRPPGR